MTASDPWEALQSEWDAWGAQGRVAGLWLRDDDACRPGAKLARLLHLTAGLPLGLAVIPGLAERTLAEDLASVPGARVLQHGFLHRNHAPPDRKKAEFGADRPIAEMCAEIRDGWQIIRDLFPDQAVAIFVPPWNRIDPRLVPRLPDCGLALLSIYGARTTEQRRGRVNTHVDIIDWQGDRGFVGDGAALDSLIRHLRARRTGRADRNEPTGILTHHNDHDEACWDFIERLLHVSRAHPAARWIDPHSLASRRD